MQQEEKFEEVFEQVAEVKTEQNNEPQLLAEDFDMTKLFVKEPKILGKVMSHMDKIDAVSVMADGRVVHKILKKNKS